jgi:hypothetical protein
MLMVVLVSREKFGFDKSAIFLQESRTLSRQHICCWCGYCHPTHESEVLWGEQDPNAGGFAGNPSAGLRFYGGRT